MGGDSLRQKDQEEVSKESLTEAAQWGPASRAYLMNLTHKGGGEPDYIFLGISSGGFPISSPKWGPGQ